MKSQRKKNLKEENYDFFQPTIEDIENQFKPNSNTTIFQILIWISIAAVVVIILNEFFLY